MCALSIKARLRVAVYLCSKEGRVTAGDLSPAVTRP